MIIVANVDLVVVAKEESYQPPWEQVDALRYRRLNRRNHGFDCDIHSLRLRHYYKRPFFS
jgi:hypothetical protein